MANTSTQIFSEQPYQRFISQLSLDQLVDIDRYLQDHLSKNSTQLRKTHYFHDRYENIYLDSTNNSNLNILLDESLDNCAGMLNVNKDALRIGYWFNLMEPGHITTLHRHDDDDELISGVIYLVVPENSGNLILELENKTINLKPVAGNFVYFDPKTPHKVGENLSSSHRLSIGMNIGIPSNRE